MKELFYFSNTKLLIKVEYAEDTNTIKYLSHREITTEEKTAIEQYILKNFAAETDYYDRYPSLLVYTGIDSSLKKDLKLLRLKKVLKVMAVHEQEVKEKVNELINNSLSTYYFERIGDSLLELRKLAEDKDIDKLVTIEQSKSNIQELIDAYNNYSDNKISFEKVVPKDLMEFFN